MRSAIVLALSVFAAVVTAAENPFNVPSGGYKFTANQPTTLTWNPTTKGTVTIKLQKAGDITPQSGTVLAPHIPNSGSYAFVPSASLGPGSDYTIEIIDDTNPSNINFTPQFSVSGTTGTASRLTGSPTVTGSATATPSTSNSSSSSTPTTSDSTTLTTSTTASNTSSATSTDSSATTTSRRTTSSSSSSSTATSTSLEPIPNPNGGAALSSSGGVLSIVLGLMAFL
ncbi:hypothetical protein PRK78_003944 [Emydomyces testavorans]|uniref:Yeast cell wall synthesis Kre9/Knh1-like N-terminal domain-containing protein n=1 Tax=Emydomyces testavorans TaxID=2070801 RepID=A0AAF0DJ79_9EURO|nr:hypothetical protein PRK78_003944 [Emydomyces testavorans]